MVLQWLGCSRQRLQHFTRTTIRRKVCSSERAMSWPQSSVMNWARYSYLSRQSGFVFGFLCLRSLHRMVYKIHEVFGSRAFMGFFV